MFGYCPNPGSAVRFTHAAVVTGPVMLRLALAGTVIASLEVVRLNACPTMPEPTVGSGHPESIALLPAPLESLAAVPVTVSASNVQ